jgi:tetratricopeptide (TPR) repeat protein
MRTLLLILLLVAPAAVAAQISIDEKPRLYMVVHVEGSTRDWEIRPIRISDKSGRTLQDASENDFKFTAERWARTGFAKRYNTVAAKAAVEKYLHGAGPEGAKFYFYAINPRQPRADGVISLVDDKKHIYWAPAEKVEVKGYPQTWVDVYEAYVTRQNGDARRLAVLEWEKAHSDIIKNVDNAEGSFSPEERNEFAIFYQEQFVFVRDREPKLPDIYTELARFHKERNNLDAELSTYLDALRAGVEGAPREQFALEVGRIFVNRLNLYGEAIPYLNMARNHTEALYLLTRCQFESGRFDEARSELNSLIATLAALPADGSIVLQTTAPEETSRAWLSLAELEFRLMNYAAANAAIAKIAKDFVRIWDEGQVLYCAMLLQRAEPRREGDKADREKVREALQKLSFWSAALALTNPGATDFPLDPLMAKALLLYAQTDSQYTDPRPTDANAKVSAEALRYLTAAKAVDPLSAEPHYAEGRLNQRRGYFIEAAAAYQAGLEVEPRHVLLNFSMADLNLKAGIESVAKDYLGRCLKYDPDFYPAHALLGELALGEVERIRASLLLRYNSGEPVDFGGELVPPMKVAAAFFTSALAIKPDQPATKLALATLYLQLSEFAPLAVADRGDAEAVKRAYLLKARDIAKELIDALEVFANTEQPKTFSERELAAIPSLACYNVYAFALYTIGDYQAALEAFQRHLDLLKERGKDYIPDTKMRQDYEKGPDVAYAEDWVRRIEQNERQYYKVDEFTQDSSANFYGAWNIPTRLKPDPGFLTGTKITGGRLHLVVEQKDSAVVSRIETEQPNATLSVFQADFTKVGENSFDFGVYLTKVVKQSDSTESQPKVSVFLGIDSQGRVFWETRKYDLEDRTQIEKRLTYGLVDVADYGGVPLKPNDKLTLSLRRQLSKDLSDVDYVGIINGYEVKLPIIPDKDKVPAGISELTNVDFNQSRYAVHCGFFTRALTGVKGTVEVESAKFIFDGGLGKK